MRSLHSILHILVALAVAPHLDAQQRSRTSAQSRVDTLVRTVQAPRYAGVAMLVEEASIGVADGNEEYMLGAVADIAIGRDGSVYVFDGQVPVVRHYDANGRFLRRIGRSGSGPGEYRSTSGIAIAPDGRLLLWDTGNWRINVYATNGDFVTQWQTPTTGGGTAQYSRALMVDSAGRINARKQIVNFRDLDRQPTVWLRYRSDGSFIDTVHAPDGPATMTVRARNGNVSTSSGVPFAPVRWVTLSPNGSLIAGFPNRYAFEIHQPDGRIVSVRRNVTPQPVSRAERSAARSRIEERMRQTDPTWSWNGPDIPETKPVYHGLTTGLDGRIWVLLTEDVRVDGPGISGTAGSGGGAPRGRRPSDSTRPSASLHDVFEADGTYLGQVQVPEGTSAMLRRGDNVWGVNFGDDDVPRLKRYRINWRR